MIFHSRVTVCQRVILTCCHHVGIWQRGALRYDEQKWCELGLEIIPRPVRDLPTIIRGIIGMPSMNIYTSDVNLTYIIIFDHMEPYRNHIIFGWQLFWKSEPNQPEKCTDDSILTPSDRSTSPRWFRCPGPGPPCLVESFTPYPWML